MKYYITKKGSQFINEKKSRRKRDTNDEEGARDKGTNDDPVDALFDQERLKFLDKRRKRD